MISAAENSNKFQKTRFWKERAVENAVTLEVFTIQFKHDFLSNLAVQKSGTYIAKQCCLSLFCNGFTLGPMAEDTLVNMNHTII
jgi:hypothetical protein